MCTKFSYVQYFSYIIDKIVFSLRRSFSKVLVILPWFLLLFLLSFLLIVYNSLAFHLEVFQSRLYRISIVWIYEYLVIPWYLNNKQVVWESIVYLLKFLITSREQSSCTLSEKKNKMFIYSFKYPIEESGKILKNEAAEPYLKPCQISIMGHFYIIDVCYDSKYTPVVVQDSKVNLKWINTKMLEKTVHFFNADLVENIPT